jgi:hypothetical protein
MRFGVDNRDEVDHGGGPDQARQRLHGVLTVFRINPIILMKLKSFFIFGYRSERIITNTSCQEFLNTGFLITIKSRLH